MLLRLCKSLAVSLPLLLRADVQPPPRAVAGFEVPYLPEVVFQGTPLTLQVMRPPQTPLLVHTNGVLLAAFPAGGAPRLELVCFPRSDLRITLTAEGTDRGWSFAGVTPESGAGLREKDGFLYAGALPAILMPQHRLPPPLDRRWETVELVESLMQPAKPAIERLLCYLPESSDLPKALQTLLPSVPLDQRPPDPQSWFRVHGYLCRNDAATPSAMLAVEIDLHDLERGMAPQAWLMKWQFALQRIQAETGYVDGLLFGPPYDALTHKWQPVLDPQLKALAAAHGLRFVDRSLDPGLWRERLRHQLSKRYRIP